MTSLDDLNARLFTLKNELRQNEGARDNALKAADDPTAQASHEQYLEYAADIEDDAAELRAALTKWPQPCWRIDQ